MIIDLLSIVFLLLTAMFCFSWVWLRKALKWNGQRAWLPLLFMSMAVVTGLWWLALALCKTLWLIIQGSGG